MSLEARRVTRLRWGKLLAPLVVFYALLAAAGAMNLAPALRRATEIGLFDAKMARRLFYDLEQGAPLEIDSSLIRDRLMISLVHVSAPFAGHPLRPLLEVTWLDARGEVLRSRKLRKTFRPRLEAEGLALFVDPGGGLTSTPRILVLDEADLPRRTRRVRLSLLEPIEGKLLARFFTKEYLSVGPRARANSMRRLERLQDRTSLPGDLQTQGVLDRTTGYRWRTQPATRGGQHAPSTVLLQRELTDEQRELTLGLLAAQRTSPSWREASRDRPLVYDVTRSGTLELLTDSPSGDDGEAPVFLELLRPGRPPAWPSLLRQRAGSATSEGLSRVLARLEVTGPATLVVRREASKPLRLRLRLRTEAAVYRVPVARDPRTSVLIGPPADLAELIAKKLARAWEGDPSRALGEALEAPTGSVSFVFAPAEAALAPVVVLALRRDGGAGPLAGRYLIEGDSLRREGTFDLQAPPADNARLDDAWPVVLSGAARLSLRLPPWGRRVRISTRTPAVVNASLSLSGLRLEQVVQAHQRLDLAPALAPTEPLSRFVLLRPTDESQHQAAGSAVTLHRQRGLVRSPANAPPPLLERTVLAPGAPTQPFLLPRRALGAPPLRPDQPTLASRNAYRRVLAATPVDVLSAPLPEPVEEIVLRSGLPALRRLLVQGTVAPAPGVDTWLRDPGHPQADRSLRHLVPARRDHPAELSADLAPRQAGRVVLDVALDSAGSAVLDVDLLDVDLVDVDLVEADTQLVSEGWPTQLTYRFRLEGQGPPALPLDPSAVSAAAGGKPSSGGGPVWRLSFPVRADLGGGGLTVRVRPRDPETTVWVAGRLAAAAAVRPGERWTARVPPDAKRVVVRDTPGRPVSAQALLADGSARSLAPGVPEPVTPAWIGVSVGASTPTDGFSIEATDARGTTSRLPRADALTSVHGLPLQVDLPQASAPRSLRVTLFWQGSEEAATPPLDPVVVELKRGDRWDSLRLRPLYQQAPRYAPWPSPAAPRWVWRSQPLSVKALAVHSRLRLLGSGGLAAVIEERVAPPESIVHVFHGAASPGVAPAQASATPLLRSFWRRGRFRRLPPARFDERWSLRVTPAALAQPATPPRTHPLPDLVSAPLTVSASQDLVELVRPVDPEAPPGGPAAVRRPVTLGRPLAVQLVDPDAPEALIAPLRLYYQELDADQPPPWLELYIDGQLALRERAVGERGALRIPDVEAGRHQLRVESSRSLGRGRLFVATRDVPRAGDLRNLSSWAPGRRLDELEFTPPPSGALLLLEVYGRAPAPRRWTRWELIEDGVDGVARRERHYVAGDPGREPSPWEADGRRLHLELRIFKRLDRSLTRGRLRGRILVHDRVRALMLSERGQ